VRARRFGAIRVGSSIVLATVLMGSVGAPVASSAPEPQLVVHTPLVDLDDGDLVGVGVSDPKPFSYLRVEQCWRADGAVGSCFVYNSAAVDAGSPPVSIRIVARHSGYLIGPNVDCAVVQCFVHVEVAQAFSAPYIERDLPIDLSPVGATAPIVVTDPPSGYTHRQSIGLAGLNFRPGVTYRVRQCLEAYGSFIVQCRIAKDVVADARGVIAARLRVHETFMVTGLATPVDCTSPVAPCFLFVDQVDTPGVDRASVMLSFAKQPQTPPNVAPFLTEVDESAGRAFVPVEIRGATDQHLVSTIAFRWRTLAWSASAADFVAHEGVQIVSARLPIVYLPVTITDDTAVEGDELVLVQVLSPINATIGGYSGIGGVVIHDDDA
jgi:hypothetical protein